MRQDIDALAETFTHTLERWDKVRDALLERLARDRDEADWWKNV